VIINSETNQPIQGVKVEITNPFEGGLNSSPSQSPFGSPSIELQEPPPLNTHNG
jgi:hypothetical protein